MCICKNGTAVEDMWSRAWITESQNILNCQGTTRIIKSNSWVPKGPPRKIRSCIWEHWPNLIAFIELCFYFPDPCILNVTAINSNNIELKWRQEELMFLHGDLIEFECKEGYDFPQTTLPSPGRTQCNHGRLKYPKCVVKGKAIFFCSFFWVHQCQTI